MQARFRLLRDLLIASLVLVAIASACVYAFSKLVPMLVTSPEADCCVRGPEAERELSRRSCFGMLIAV
ncbi:hypothetical protein [Hydrocarboniphaga effusa]|jgi:hypothetical protein|uniref:hypothetical protein n=1 Tax=Hydrocarboniphaga effusa TaxID=243629 RepID=UPI0031384455